MVSSTCCQQKCPHKNGCLPAVHIGGTATNATNTASMSTKIANLHPSSTLHAACSLKAPLKGNRNGPSPLRQLLPIAMFLLAFATVLSILIVYMDTTGKFIMINSIFMCNNLVLSVNSVMFV